MQIERIDHFTIVAQPAEIELLREFYCEVLGLTPGPRPGFAFDGYWLYPPTGGPLVHLADEIGHDAPDMTVFDDEALVRIACESRSGQVARTEPALSGEVGEARVVQVEVQPSESLAETSG